MLVEHTVTHHTLHVSVSMPRRRATAPHALAIFTEPPLLSYSQSIPPSQPLPPATRHDSGSLAAHSCRVAGCYCYGI